MFTKKLTLVVLAFLMVMGLGATVAFAGGQKGLASYRVSGYVQFEDQAIQWAQRQQIQATAKLMLYRQDYQDGPFTKIREAIDCTPNLTSGEFPLGCVYEDGWFTFGDVPSAYAYMVRGFSSVGFYAQTDPVLASSGWGYICLYPNFNELDIKGRIQTFDFGYYSKDVMWNSFVVAMTPNQYSFNTRRVKVDTWVTTWSHGAEEVVEEGSQQSWKQDLNASQPIIGWVPWKLSYVTYLLKKGSEVCFHVRVQDVNWKNYVPVDTKSCMGSKRGQ